MSYRDPKCGICRFCETHFSARRMEDVTQCRRRAPVVYYQQAGLLTNGAKLQGWPEVELGDWCGEYEERAQ